MVVLKCGKNSWEDHVHRLALERQYIKKHKKVYNILSRSEPEQHENSGTRKSNILLYTGKDENGKEVSLEFVSISGRKENYANKQKLKNERW